MLELARPEDRAAVNRILVQGHALHAAWRPDLYRVAEDIVEETWFLEQIQEKRLYVARLHGATAGFVWIRFAKWDSPLNVPRKILMVEEFFVEESCRNLGIGTRMMQDVLALARAFGCSDVELSVYPQNEAALALYRKFGFTVRNINMQRKV